MQQPTLPLWGPCLAIALEFLSHAGLPEYIDRTGAGSRWFSKLHSAVPQRASEQELAVPSMSMTFPTFSQDIDAFVWAFGSKYRSCYERWMDTSFGPGNENGLQLLDGSNHHPEGTCPCTTEKVDEDAEQPHFRAYTLHHFYGAVRHALILAALVRTIFFIGVLCAMPWSYMKRSKKL